LGEITPEVLSPTAQARLFVTYIHNYQDLGDEQQVPKYLELIDKLPEDPLAIDQRLRADYAKIRRMLTKGIHSPASKLIRRGIRLAVKHKAHRSLCSMYFIASTMYYELGDYRRTLKFLDKAIRAGRQRVSTEWSQEWVIRYAYIYRKLGLYGNAIERAENVVSRIDTSRGHQQYFTALTTLLDNCVTINSGRVAEILPKLTSAAKLVRDRLRLASYHRSLGRYYAKSSETNLAIKEYEIARNHFSAVGMMDEQVGAEISIASLLITQGRIRQADELITRVGPQVESIESKNIKGEYLALQLKYLLAMEGEKSRIEECIQRCEAIRDNVTDVNAAMELDVQLFNGAVALRATTKALETFDRYYKKVRFVVSNLPKDYVSDYIRNPQLTSMIDMYRRLKKLDPGQL
jgi:tetratricopeptide (TPR) repeat protein